MTYVFGDFTLDIRLYELRRAGKPVKLEPQVFNVLVYLVQHRDRVVTKQELFEHLWPDQFVGDAALERCIRSARQAVGDSGRTQRLIKTLYGRGYRFLAAVEERILDPLGGKDLATPSTPSESMSFINIGLLTVHTTTSRPRLWALRMIVGSITTAPQKTSTTATSLEPGMLPCHQDSKPMRFSGKTFR